jgi:hypothetical protein
MRDVFNDPAAVAVRGAEARRSVCSRLAWDSLYTSLQQHLSVLTRPFFEPPPTLTDGSMCGL